MPIDHFSHHHPLGLGLCSHEGTEELINCNGCEQLINSGSQVYSCECCKYYLHKSCVELEKEIQHHIFHPQHTLTLLPRALSYGGNFECDACEKQGCTGFLYRCHHCDFNLEIQCTNSLKPVVNFPGTHEHSLVYLEKRSYASMCNCNCRKYSYGQLFRCVQCRFNIKFDCFPFPKAVKLRFHRHELTFSEPLKREEEEEEEGEDDSIEFVCDACEQDRDPKQHVYYCAEPECNFVAHFLCGITEYEYIVEENKPHLHKLGDFKLERDEKIPEEDGIIKPALTFLIFSDSIVENDRKELNSVLEAITSKHSEFQDTFFKDQQGESSDDLETSLRKFEPFVKFMISFDTYTRNATLNFKHVKITSEIVEVRDYMIPKNLAPTLEALFGKYGDISEESTLSLKTKMYIVTNLCDAINNMQNTKFVQLTESLLFSWWLSFKYAQQAGFRVQFIVDQLKRLTRAVFGFQVKASLNLTVEEIDKSTAEIQLKLKKLEEERARHLTCPRSKFREMCLREESLLKMENAGTGLL